MPVTLPYDLTVPPKREIKSAELMAMFNALKDKFSAGIVDADCSAGMNLNGVKIQANSIPANRIIDGSIADTQLADLSVGTSELKLDSVTHEKVAAAAIAKAELITTEHIYSVGGPTFSNTTFHITAAMFTPALPASTAGFILAVGGEGDPLRMVFTPNSSPTTLRVSMSNPTAGTLDITGYKVKVTVISLT